MTRQADNDDNLASAMGDQRYGWFIQAIDHAFGFLVRDLGYHVADVLVHFRGTYVVYRLGQRSVTIELDPDSMDLRCDVETNGNQGGAGAATTPVWAILKSRDSDTDWHEWPRQRGLSNRAVVALLDQWASGLRRLAPDVLAR